MRARLLLRLLLLAWVALLSACATGPRTVDIPRQQLVEALAQRFPYELRPGELFAVRVDMPQLQLVPHENRLRLDFLAEISDRLLRSAVRADLGVSFGLRYEASDATLRATSVRIEHIALQGLPTLLQRQMQLAGAAVAERLLEGTVLHTFRPEEIMRARGWTPGVIRVTPGGVRVELLPPVAALPAGDMQPRARLFPDL